MNLIVFVVTMLARLLPFLGVKRVVFFVRLESY